MKIKSDFVTNSSSSSFIISDSSGKLDKILVYVTKNLTVNLFDELNYKEITEDNMKELHDEYKNIIEKIKNILVCGGKVYRFWASSDGKTIVECGFFGGCSQEMIYENKNLLEVLSEYNGP